MLVHCCDLCQGKIHRNPPEIFTVSIPCVADITIKIQLRNGKDLCLDCLQEYIDNKIELIKRG
jgi:hypothetical protein